MADAPISEEKVALIPRAPVPAQSVRPPFTYSVERDDAITFKHPGYPDQFGQNILLSLFAFDHPTGGFGLHYGTAHLACALVACNAWDGYFTRTRDGEALQCDRDDLLVDRVLYFHVPSSTGRYPIYPDFDNWAFPHDNLPPHWPSAVRSEDGPTDQLGAPPSSSTLTAAVLRRDKACIVSKLRDGVERAHLCPRSGLDWFDVNGMSQYNINRQLAQDTVVDDISNTVALRSDLHTTFDARKFVFAFKKDKWLVHFTDLTSDLGQLYHNTPPALHQDVSSKYLLVRFAWTVFPSVSKFLTTGAGRVVRMRTVVDDELQEVTRKMGVEEARAKFGGGRSRSTSPKKRKGGTTALEPNDADSGSKRRRLHSTRTSDARQSMTASGGEPESRVDLSNSPEFPTSLTPVSPEQQCSNDEAQRLSPEIDHIKRAWLLEQRSTNLHNYCCDYYIAEVAAKTGVAGKKEWGGGHLCDECLGAEYRNEEIDNE
ncbi:hypothetical protein MBLNU459_g5549t1 [Dothideomycetes sp. NU459]